MSSFTYTWNNGTPVGSTPANQLDTVIQDMKAGLYERLGLEHQALDSTDTIESATAAGRHIPGKVSAVYIGTTAQIAALTGMLAGALAWDTQLRCLKIYNGSSWDSIIMAAGSYAFAARSSTSWSQTKVEQKTVFQTEDYDDGGIFVPGVTSDDALSRATVVADGNYYFSASCGLYSNTSGKVSCKVFKNGAEALCGMAFTTNLTNQNHAHIAGVIKAVAGDYFEVYCRYEGTLPRTSIGGTGQGGMSFFSGFRVT